MNSLSKAVAPRMLGIRASAPKLFFVGGIVGVVATTVLACRATLKLETTLDDHVNEDDELNRVRAAVSVVRLYAPAAIVGVASITMLTQSHNILVRRNAALSAAYTTLERGFNEYRARVVEKYGKDEDDRLRYGFEVEKVTKGDKKSVVHHAHPESGASIYAVFFDEYNPNWSKDPEINKLFLKAQQNYFNDLLRARGHVFLNEVYSELGFGHTKAGAVVGWKLSPEGDNFIDFGVFSADAPDQIREFVNGREGSVLLDFNVDGLIYNKIGEEPSGEYRWYNEKWYRR